MGSKKLTQGQSRIAITIFLVIAIATLIMAGIAILYLNNEFIAGTMGGLAILLGGLLAAWIKKAFVITPAEHWALIALFKRSKVTDKLDPGWRLILWPYYQVKEFVPVSIQNYIIEEVEVPCRIGNLEELEEVGLSNYSGVDQAKTLKVNVRLYLSMKKYKYYSITKANGTVEHFALPIKKRTTKQHLEDFMRYYGEGDDKLKEIYKIVKNAVIQEMINAFHDMDIRKLKELPASKVSALLTRVRTRLQPPEKDHHGNFTKTTCVPVFIEAVEMTEPFKPSDHKLEEALDRLAKLNYEKEVKAAEMAAKLVEAEKNVEIAEKQAEATAKARIINAKSKAQELELMIKAYGIDKLSSEKQVEALLSQDALRALVKIGEGQGTSFVLSSNILSEAKGILSGAKKDLSSGALRELETFLASRGTK